MRTERHDEELRRAVQTRRARRGRDDRERSLAQNLALAGVLGWTIVLPCLGGIAIGRWLDRALGTGVLFTSALLFAGVIAGGSLAWRRIRR